jgi:hypothetical protein
VQNKIKNMLPENEAFIEHRFESNIADLYWPKENIAFEIQCSQISIDLAIKRTKAYEKMGIKVIWLLHEKNFNGKYLSLAELYLRKTNRAYYTNITSAGTGYVFDQIDDIKNNLRVKKGIPIIINLKKPIYKFNKLYFEGAANLRPYYKRAISVLTKSVKSWYTSHISFFSTKID